MSHVTWDLHPCTDALTNTNAVELSILPSSPGSGKSAVCPGRDLARGVPHDGGQGQQKALRVHDGEGPRTAVQPSHCAVAVVVFLSSVVECGCSVSVGALAQRTAGFFETACIRAMATRSLGAQPDPDNCVTLRCMYDACTFARLLLSIAIGQERPVDFCLTLGETVHCYVACTR